MNLQPALLDSAILLSITISTDTIYFTEPWGTLLSKIIDLSSIIFESKEAYKNLKNRYKN